MGDTEQNECFARRIRVYGRVQGVGYRFWAEGQAHRLGLYGWVRNRLDGSVEVLAVGERAKVETMIAACHDGPEHAEVKQVIVEPTPGIVGQSFTRKPTV